MKAERWDNCTIRLTYYVWPAVSQKLVWAWVSRGQNQLPKRLWECVNWKEKNDINMLTIILLSQKIQLIKLCNVVEASYFWDWSGTWECKLHSRFFKWEGKIMAISVVNWTSNPNRQILGGRCQLTLFLTHATQTRSAARRLAASTV